MIYNERKKEEESSEIHLRSLELKSFIRFNISINFFGLFVKQRKNVVSTFLIQKRKKLLPLLAFLQRMETKLTWFSVVILILCFPTSFETYFIKETHFFVLTVLFVTFHSLHSQFLNVFFTFNLLLLLGVSKNFNIRNTRNRVRRILLQFLFRFFL